MSFCLQPYITLLQLHHPVDDLRIGVTRNKFLHEELHNAASNAVQAPRHRASKTKSVPRQRLPSSSPCIAIGTASTIAASNRKRTAF